ncbi:MAG: hypothetical protein N3F08_02470 [Crenarchaeota archaeon]|nr:hypothetical protein [Thermoproteota archaeon]
MAAAFLTTLLHGSNYIQIRFLMVLPYVFLRLEWVSKLMGMRREYYV